ncbi:diacylglycerol kinase [Snodgrassella sp. CFCC 13594]|uniref:diacylglycerol kinase n=1 Tax=Snodgrassella sp. CFCC 13594 TaxID=1775559 RepID=UPI00083187A7|nr:diacylglycerol kinase [Snodgrassella sp. CFCC 13594]
MDTKKATPFAQQIKGKTGFRRIMNAYGYSLAGLKAALSEAAFRQLLVFHVVLIVLAFILDFGPATRMMLIMASFISWIVELFNTAIEAAVDHTSLAKHPLAKRAKDTASAAQFLALTLVVILWLMALWRDYGPNVF